jgi:uncharacterized protein involved in exopolysaccharide biosynthesis
MAVTMASEDRLRTFNEIIYSRTTIQRLIDSIGLAKKETAEKDRQSLIDAVQKNITIERRGSDSFRISYLDTDPTRAQHAASSLSTLFIETILHVEGQRNEQAVEFFEKKLEDLHQKFEFSQKEVVSQLQQHVNTAPAENRAVYTQLETAEKEINDVDTRVKIYQQSLLVLRTFPDALHTETGKQSLYDLQRSDLPYIQDLRLLLGRYDDFLRRYTPKYPEVVKLEQQILDLIERMRNGVESELAKQQPLRLDLERRRAQLVDNIRQSSVSARVDEDKESDYGIYRKLYDEMKVKLEQAKTSRDLGSKGANQFIIIDPALIPTAPSKPNRFSIMLSGLALGLFIGFLSVIIRELLDTTIRLPKDIEIYQKPVIAFISEGNEKRLNP